MEKIYNFEIKNNMYEIALSSHATQRMEQRGITEDNILDNILSLTTKQMEYLSRNSLECIVIDKETEIAVVIGFNKVGLVTVLTVIKRDNIKVKPDTIEIYIYKEC